MVIQLHASKSHQSMGINGFQPPLQKVLRFAKSFLPTLGEVDPLGRNTAEIC